MKVAVIHDWLVTYAGAERVLAQILKCFPEADLFAVVDHLDDAARKQLGGYSAKTTFVQGMPWSKSKYRAYLPFMPLAIEQLDMTGYDLVISSSHAVAKGVLTGPDQLHVSYVHSPIRYAWDLQHQYLRETGKGSGIIGWLVRYLLHRIRLWDVRSANGVDEFVCNSKYIARRTLKAYRRPSTVIYPPVDTSGFTPGAEKEDFYLTASRMVPYKRIDLIVEAFSAMPSRRLVVIGDGPEMAKIRQKAGPNVEIMGYQAFAVLKDKLQRAKGFVFAAEEDFGILPVEAQACGTPVIAFGKGGLTETVRTLAEGKPSGLLFPEQSVEAIVAAIEQFETDHAQYTVEAAVANAARFSEERFRNEFSAFVLNAYERFKAGI